MTAATPGLQSDLSRRVLVVDDDSGMRMALEMCFSQRGWHVESASGKKEALTRFCRGRHSLVVSDIRMPDGNGLEIMRAAKEIRPATAVILLTAFGCVPDAVAAMKAGACEYLTKPVTFEQLLDRAEELVTRSAKQTESGDRIGGARIIGSSPALLKAIDDGERAAQSNADILIEAESGTGKELLARMIHEHGARHDGPFVAVNCAALPESLLESELFGHGRGAFTGAFASQAGKFEAANRGTLLLDEIGELPLSLQPKLLRVLEEREFYRLGELRRVKLDVRVIASTNRRLAAMVKQGTFRADLYYRLNVIPLTLPPLRERRKDVRELAGYFAQRFAPDGLPVNFSDSFLLDLEQYAWPERS